MTKASDEFEIMISRIHELLEGEDAVVEWNERIPDPDNPKQLRQVDVIVKKDGLINLIECRLHKDPQNVKWIEELIGRRDSLQANAIVAVASNGFTSGAIKKANKYGILLKDTAGLTDEDIRSWSRSINISIFFYRYEGFKLGLYFDYQDARNLDLSKLNKDLQNYIGFRSLFTAQLELIDSKNLIRPENRKNKVDFKVDFAIEDFKLCGCGVKQVQAEGAAYLEEIKLQVPEVLAYGDPEIESNERNVYIQKFKLGETRIIHHDGNISMSLDLSKLDTPPYWQFRFVNVSGEHENNMDSFEIVHPEKIVMTVDKVDLSIISAGV